MDAYSRILAQDASATGPRLGERDQQRASAREAAADHASWRTVVMSAVKMWIISRVVYAALTYVALTISAATPATARSFLQAWNRWDTGWFLIISQQGYASRMATAFFPLYPGLIGGVSWLLGDGHSLPWPAYDPIRLVVALTIANLGTLVGFVGLSLLAWTEWRSTAAADRVVRAAVAYPFAFMLAAGYSEGLFLAEATFCLLFARRGRWYFCALAAVLAGLTRPTAAVLVAPILWEYSRQHGWWRSASWLSIRRWRDEIPALARGVLVVSAAPAGTAAFMGYLWLRFGTPFTGLQVESEVWGRHLAAPWTTATMVAHSLLQAPAWSQAEAKIILVTMTLIAVSAVTLLGLRTMPFAFTLYMLGLVAVSVASPIPSSYEVIDSAGRFLVVSVPVFLILGRWMARRPSLDFLVANLGFGVQALLVAAYLSGGDGLA